LKEAAPSLGQLLNGYSIELCTKLENCATPTMSGDIRAERILIVARNGPAKIIHAKRPPHQRLRSNALALAMAADSSPSR
jgi:hypothetical protein